MKQKAPPLGQLECLSAFSVPPSYRAETPLASKIWESQLLDYCKKLLLSGKICLFILENTNFTNNTNPCGMLSLLIAYELHEYHPDGIRVIRLWLRNIHPAWRLTCATFGSCHSWNSCSLKHRNSRFFRLNIYEGLVWVQLSIKQRVIYIYRTAI